jgi:hypothetical protein
MPDPEDRAATREGEAPEEGDVRGGAIYPYNDGQGGTAYAVGGEGGEEATYEEWAAQQGIALPPEEVDEDGNPVQRDADD